MDTPTTPRKQPVWTYFLTPAAVVLGATIIAGAVWWTRDDDAPASTTDHNLSLVEPVTTVGPGSTGSPGATAVAGGSLRDTVYGYARQVGLNEGQFDQCVKNAQNLEQINAGIEAGNTLGVTGTPTFFINNKKLVGAQPYAVLKEIVDAELKGSPTSLDGYSNAVKQLAATTPPGFQIVTTKPDTTGAAFEGSPNAKVVIAEFSDFQCPFCKQWTDTTLKQLRAELGNQVSLAFLHFPIQSIHPNAGSASLVALCAQEQGKFWEMHDLLFAKQAEWAALK